MSDGILRNDFATDKGYWVRIPKANGSTFNAWLTGADRVTRFPLWIYQMGIDFSLKGSTAQSQMTRSYFPRNFSQPTVVFRGQCLDQANYRKLGEFVRRQQVQAVSSGKVMGVTVPRAGNSVAGKQRGPRDGFSAEGYVLTMQTGAGFGEFTPEYELPFVVSRNRSGIGGWEPHPGSLKSLRIKTWAEIFLAMEKNTGGEGVSFTTDPDRPWIDRILDGTIPGGGGLAH